MRLIKYELWQADKKVEQIHRITDVGQALLSRGQKSGAVISVLSSHYNERNVPSLRHTISSEIAEKYPFRSVEVLPAGECNSGFLVTAKWDEFTMIIETE